MLRRVERFSLGMPWEESHGYTQAFKVGPNVHVSGQIPHDDTGNLIGLDDAAEQARAVLRNLDRVLTGIGATRRQITETTIMVVGLSKNLEAISDAHRRYFDTHRPASTALGVAELAFPGQLVEISAQVCFDLPR